MSNKTTLNNSKTLLDESSITILDTKSDITEKEQLHLETFLNYKIVRQLETEGAEADIYIITKENREYILKLYRYGIEPKEEVINFLLDMSQKFPEDIVKIYKIDFNKDMNRWYEIQEYAQYGSLKDYKSSNLTSKEIRHIISEINSILISLHNNNIIHRDIKPANILLRNENPLDLIMTDFGISSVLDEEMSKKMTSKSGTRIYFAPESFSGVIGKEVDLWAFGIILLELITGENIFQGINEGLVAYEIHTKGVAVPVNIDNNLSNLLKGLLTRDPKKRWSVKEVSLWLNGKKDIPLYYDYSSETSTGYEKPYTFNNKKYYSLVSLSAEFAKSEENWKNGLAHYYRGYISKWLENNEDYDSSISIDNIKEVTQDRNIALAELIYKYNPDLEFIVYGKLIDLNNLLLFTGKYLNNTSNTVEKQIVEDITTETLQKYYDIYCKYGKCNNIFTDILLNISKIKRNISKENAKQLYIHNIYKYLEVFVKRDRYYFPYGFENINPNNLLKNISKLDNLFTKSEFELLEKKYLLPISFKNALKSANSIGLYLQIKKKFQKELFIKKEQFNKVNEDIDILQFFNVKDCCSDEKIYFEIFKFIESGYGKLQNFLKTQDTYILPKIIEQSKKESFKDIYDNLEILTYLTKNKFQHYKERFYLPIELEYIQETEGIATFISYIEYFKNINISCFEKEKLKDYENTYHIPKDIAQIKSGFPLKEYEEYIKKFNKLLDSDKLVKLDNKLLKKLILLEVNLKKLFKLDVEFLDNIDEYEKIILIKKHENTLNFLLKLEQYILPADFNDICKTKPLLLLELQDILLTKEYINNILLPSSFKISDHQTYAEYSKEIKNLNNYEKNVKLISLKEYEKIINNSELLRYVGIENIERSNIDDDKYLILSKLVEMNIINYSDKYLLIEKIENKIDLNDSIYYKFTDYLTDIKEFKKVITEVDSKILYHLYQAVYYSNTIETFKKKSKNIIYFSLGTFVLMILGKLSGSYLKDKEFSISLLTILIYALISFVISLLYEGILDVMSSHKSKQIENYLIEKIDSLAENEHILIKSLLNFIDKNNKSNAIYLNIMFKIGELEYSEKNYDEALKYLIIPAEEGNNLAQFYIGYIYNSIKKDYQLGTKWYQKSCQKIKRACYYLGLNYLYGRGVNKNYLEAIKLFDRADDDIESSTAFEIGMKYYNGDELAKNIQDTVHWLKKAIKDKHEDAFFYLGYIYRNGMGNVNKNVSKAIEYYKEAVELGCGTSANNLGNIYRDQKNYSMAIKMYTLGIERDDTLAFVNLAECYFEGWGVEKNRAKAIELLNNAPESERKKWVSNKYL